MAVKALNLVDNAIGKKVGRYTVRYTVNNSRKYGYKEVRKKERDIKGERVTVQVTEREKEMLTLLAKRNGQTVSEYIRVNCIWDPYNKLTGGDYYE